MQNTIEEQHLIDNFAQFGSAFAVMSITPDPNPNKHDKKVPLDPKDDHIMKWKNNPRFMTIADTVDYKHLLEQNFSNGKFAIGLYLGACDALMLDLDDIPQAIADKDKPDSELDKLRKLTQNTYTEISQSGTGVHFILRGKKIRSIIRNDKYEFYEKDRWATLTGNTIWGTSLIKELTEDQMKALEFYLWGPEKPKLPVLQPVAKGNNLSLQALLEKISNSKDGKKFLALYNGKSIIGDQSKDDMSFVCMATWWTNHDMKLVDQLFRQSRRMRPKWDQDHSADGRTYGQMTLEKADAAVSGGYRGNFDLDKAVDQLNATEAKSLDELYDRLKKAHELWDLAHPKSKNPIDGQNILNILESTVHFAVLYSTSQMQEIKKAPLYYYDPSLGYWCNDTETMERFILAIDPDLTNSKARLNLIDTLRKRPSNQIVYHQLTSALTREWYAVGNGVLNLNTKELVPYDPKKWFFTTKIDTPYDKHADMEPLLGKWQFSKFLETVADGDKDKLILLWQTCKAAIFGFWWLRQAVLLIDDGHGRTGKSTFEQALINVRGQDNTTSLRFSEMQDETKLIDAENVGLIVGDDNDAKTVISHYENINPLVSGELVRVRDYYKKSHLTQVHTFILQSCNGLPPFQNGTEAFFARLKIIKFKKHYNNNVRDNWDIKHRWIYEDEFKKWLLWYVVNKVDLDIALQDTKENRELIGEARLESNSVDAFVENELDNLDDAKYPTAWLYSFYATTCIIENREPLSKNTFTREIMQNKKFTDKFKRVKYSRIKPDADFSYNSAVTLVKLMSTIKTGYKVQNFFPISHKTVTKGDPDDKVSISETIIQVQDFINRLNTYHGAAFVNTQLPPTANNKQSVNPSNNTTTSSK